MLERGPAVEPEAGNAHHGELDGQHVPFLPRRKVSRCAVHRADGRIGKGLGVKPRRVLGVARTKGSWPVPCLLMVMLLWADEADHARPPGRVAMNDVVRRRELRADR